MLDVDFYSPSAMIRSKDCDEFFEDGQILKSQSS